MDSIQTSRRGFMGKAAGWTVLTGMTLSARAEPSVSTGSVRLGAPVFEKTDDPEQLARAHKHLRYRAAYCPEVPLSDSKRIQAIEEAYARHDIVIAEVGRWNNMMDGDADKRKHNLETVIDGLALADAIGARCCVNIAGSFSTDSWFGPHPKNLSQAFFDAAVENARKVIDAVDPKRATFAYEMMGWSLPDSADAYLKLFKAVDRKGFGIHLDPCNIINCPERFYQNAAVINECFDKLGPHIVSCHAKDLTWDIEMNVHFREVCPGTGAIDYAVFLKRLAEMPREIPLMIEHLSGPDEYDQARKYILEQGEKLGIQFT